MALQGHTDLFPRLVAELVELRSELLVEELQHDKPDEYDQLVREGKLEEHLVEPMPKSVERGFRAFGFTALFVGLTLIGLIIYAMLFGYR